MPRDYKSNTYRTKKPLKKLSVDSWDRVLIVVFITILALVVKHFIVAKQEKPSSLVTEIVTKDNKTDAKVSSVTTAVAAFAKEVAAAGGLTEEELNADPTLTAEQQAQVNAETAAKLQAEAQAKQKAANTPPRQDTIPVEPHFDFYTILPKVEVEIPDHEIKTRIREEKIGAGDKNAKYVMQAGSFRDSPEAERLKAKLTALGIESRVEKAQVGEVTWYRVKVGPYTGMTSVMTVKSQLRGSSIDAVVLEFK